MSECACVRVCPKRLPACVSMCALVRTQLTSFNRHAPLLPCPLRHAPAAQHTTAAAPPHPSLLAQSLLAQQRGALALARRAKPPRRTNNPPVCMRIFNTSSSSSSSLSSSSSFRGQLSAPCAAQRAMRSTARRGAGARLEICRQLAPTLPAVAPAREVGWRNGQWLPSRDLTLRWKNKSGGRGTGRGKGDGAGEGR